MTLSTVVSNLLDIVRRQQESGRELVVEDVSDTAVLIPEIGMGEIVEYIQNRSEHPNWRPRITRKSVFEQMPPRLNIDEVTPLYGDDYHMRQYGRALALLPYYEYVGLDGAWHMLQHKHENRQIRVTLRDAHYFVVEERESALVEWKPNMSTSGYHTREVGVNRSSLLAWTDGNWPFEHKRLFREWGGVWNVTSKVYRFNHVTDTMRVFFERRYWNKYAMLVKLLNDKGFIFSSGNADQFMKIDGYQREMWSLAGHYWQSFPQRPVEHEDTASFDDTSEAMADWLAREMEKRDEDMCVVDELRYAAGDLK